MNRSKIGVIGVGYLGRIHAAKYMAIPGVELVGVTDANKNTAQDVANHFGIRVFHTLNEMLERVDAVSVVVPTKQHFKVARQCLEKGVDVFLEKPMTTTVEEADALVELASSCNRILQIGHIEQFNPAVLAMEPYLTTPLFIEAQRIHAFNIRGADVDVVLDLMIHDIDIILSIVHSPLRTMHSVGAPVITSASDIANTRLIFENGCTANITASRISQTATRKLRVFQPDSYICVDSGLKEISISKQNRKKIIDGVPEVVTQRFSFPDKDALETELKAFVLNVQQRTTPKIDGKAGRKALNIALKIIDQIKNHLSEHGDLLV
jgi:predicted dehydrogenase